jgi:hypothetical protein
MRQSRQTLHPNGTDASHDASLIALLPASN